MIITPAATAAVLTAGLLWLCAASSAAAATLSESEDARVAEVHRMLGDRLPWRDGGRPGAGANAVVTVLRSANREGLRPSDYPVAEIEALWNDRGEAGLRARLITGALLRYLDDVRLGRPDAANGRRARIPVADAARLVAGFLASDDPVNWLLGQSPQHRHYRELKRALAVYRAIESDGGLPLVDDGPIIRPGHRDPRVPALRERLRREGIEVAEGDDPELYDSGIREAMVVFQQRRGLQPDGHFGNMTRAEMNVDAGRLVDRIRLAMERWRRGTRDLGSRHVLVNVPAFTLEAVDESRVVLEMPVIVGAPAFATPDIETRINQLELNPYWNVPTSIVVNEFLPELRRDPQWLQANRHRLFAVRDGSRVEIDPAGIDWNELGNGIARYRVRQDPGPWNALGTVKFVMPNDHDIYLHDTPHRSLFGLAGRALSHGCIRLSRPLDMVAFALDSHPESGWFKRVQDDIASGENSRISLPRSLPVHLVYRTAWVDSNG